MVELFHSLCSRTRFAHFCFCVVFSSIFSRLEAASDVIPGVPAGYVGLDVRVQFDDSRSYGSRDIRGADCVSNERTNEQIEGYHIRPTNGLT